MSKGPIVMNRSRRARENAGLSIGQAARMLGVEIGQLRRVEESDGAYADADPPRLADLYGVNLEWLSGRCAQHDYERLNRWPDAAELPFRDRDMIAELYASLPRQPPQDDVTDHAPRTCTPQAPSRTP
jgi:transcriptional regulator with XRE-family HTH domain